MTMNKSLTTKNAPAAGPAVNVDKKAHANAPEAENASAKKKSKPAVSAEKSAPVEEVKTTPSKSVQKENPVPTTVFMSPRDEIRARKEAKRLEEEGHLTFKPKISAKKATKGASSAGDGTSPPTTIFARLSENKKKAESEASTPTSAPKPKATPESINRLYAGTGKAKTSSAYDVVEEPRAPKPKKVTAEAAAASVKRMYAQADKLKEKLDLVKSKVESETQSQCTFKPELSSKHKGPEKLEGELAADYNKRLEVYAAERSKHLEEARRQRAEAELQECSFKPALRPRPASESPTPASSCRKPVGPSEEEECTFRPQLVTSRHAPAGTTRTGGLSVHERLFKSGVAALKDQEALRARLLEEELEQTCTFSPRLERPIGEASPPPSGALFERLANAKKEDLSAVKEQLELSECTFRPQVPELVTGVNRSTVPIHERLSAEAEQLRAEAARREAVKIENELKGATFAPEIPVVSTVLARKKTEEALLAAEAQEANELEAAALVITPENSPKKNGISQGKSAGSSSPTAALAAEFDLAVIGNSASIHASPEAPIAAAANE